ncbi:MAG: ComEA family DNA-binding protein [Cetobacterium sp.]|uniref:ComEA family DNA-binding protein n=1 Tax=Cetobacterium sp. TaxID=2071632 RepID=UPI003F39945E
MNRVIIILLTIFILSNAYKPSINTATYTGLDSVVGIGEVKTKLILEEIKKEKFKNADDFKERTGHKIGDKVFKRLNKKYKI